MAHRLLHLRAHEKACHKNEEALRRFIRRRALTLPSSVKAYAASQAPSFGLTPTAFLTETLRIIAHDDMALAILGDIYSAVPR